MYSLKKITILNNCTNEKKITKLTHLWSLSLKHIRRNQALQNDQ